jgi:hypothetical protein
MLIMLLFSFIQEFTSPHILCWLYETIIPVKHPLFQPLFLPKIDRERGSEREREREREREIS